MVDSVSFGLPHDEHLERLKALAAERREWQSTASLSQWVAVDLGGLSDDKYDSSVAHSNEAYRLLTEYSQNPATWQDPNYLPHVMTEIEAAEADWEDFLLLSSDDPERMKDMALGGGVLGLGGGAAATLVCGPWCGLAGLGIGGVGGAWLGWESANVEEEPAPELGNPMFGGFFQSEHDAGKVTENDWRQTTKTEEPEDSLGTDEQSETQGVDEEFQAYIKQGVASEIARSRPLNTGELERHLIQIGEMALKDWEEGEAPSQNFWQFLLISDTLDLVKQGKAVPKLEFREQMDWLLGQMFTYNEDYKHIDFESPGEGTEHIGQHFFSTFAPNYAANHSKIQNLKDFQSADCDLQTYGIVGLHWYVQHELEDHEVLLVQKLPPRKDGVGHVQPVIYNTQTKEFWNLASNTRTQVIEGALYEPEVLWYGALAFHFGADRFHYDYTDFLYEVQPQSSVAHVELKKPETEFERNNRQTVALPNTNKGVRPTGDNPDFQTLENPYASPTTPSRERPTARSVDPDRKWAIVEKYRSRESEHREIWSKNLDPREISTSAIEKHLSRASFMLSDLGFIPETHVVQSHEELMSYEHAARAEVRRRFLNIRDSVIAYLENPQMVATEDIQTLQEMANTLSFYDSIPENYGQPKASLFGLKGEISNLYGGAAFRDAAIDHSHRVKSNTYQFVLAFDELPPQRLYYLTLIQSGLNHMINFETKNWGDRFYDADAFAKEEDLWNFDSYLAGSLESGTIQLALKPPKPSVTTVQWAQGKGVSPPLSSREVDLENPPVREIKQAPNLPQSSYWEEPYGVLDENDFYDPAKVYIRPVTAAALSQYFLEDRVVEGGALDDYVESDVLPDAVLEEQRLVTMALLRGTWTSAELLEAFYNEHHSLERLRAELSE